MIAFVRLGLVLCAAAFFGCKDKTASQTAGSAAGSGSATSVGGSSSAEGSGSASDAAGGSASDAGSGSAATIGSGSAAGAGSGSAASIDTNAPATGTSAASTGSAVPTGSAGPTTPPAVAAAAADAGVAAGELEYDDKSAPIELKIAFANHVPKLPAVSADGASIADYGSDASRPTRPSPIFVRVVRLDGKGKSERLEIVDQQMVEANADAGDWSVSSPPASVVKVLSARAAAVAARLHGYSSLSSVETHGSNKRSAKIGAFKLASTEKTDRQGGLLLVLTDARGKTVQREQIRSYSDGAHPEALDGGACEYRPKFQGAYLDPTKRRLYLAVAFRWREECTPQEPRFVAWEL